MFSTTYRWNDGVDGERYDAVELRTDDLVWYAWSHRHGQGRHDEATQSFEAFLRDGPLRTMPAHAAAELERLVRQKLAPS
jgi:hypothetical protein